MKKIIKLRESDLRRIVKRVINEDEITTSEKLSGKGRWSYRIDEKSIYNAPYGYGGGTGFQTVRGNQVWLNNKGQSNWPSGDANRATIAVYQLIKALDGIDWWGTGAKIAMGVASDWASFDLNTQNEFLKQWYKSKGGKEWGTPWRALSDDYESEIAGQMIKNSINKVKEYCKSYVDLKNKSDEINQPKPNVVCDTFIESYYTPY